LTDAPYPHLVVISQAIPHSMSAGPTQLMRLLQRWPADRLTVYGPQVPEGAETLDCAYVPFAPPLARLQYTRLRQLVTPAGLIMRSAPRCSIPAGPAVVLSVMQLSPYYRAAARVARRQGRPLALIVHDDPEEIEAVAHWARPLARRSDTSIYRFAKARFCVSPQMRDALAARYGAAGEVTYPIAPASLRPRALELNKTLRRRSGLVLGYAGSLNYGYDQALAPLLQEIQQCKATLRIYSLQKPWFLSGPGVEYAGGLSAGLPWKQIQDECDAMILPYHTGPNRGYAALYRTHFPSKLVEYLGLGMPVVMTGPEYATGMQWGLAHPDACIALPDGGPATLANALRELAGNPDLRLTLAQNALRALDREFNAKRIQRAFHQRLVEIANANWAG
jgi:glycosyltransferase involved in cell wall biosynthesis